MENFYEREKNSRIIFNLKRFFTNLFNKSKLLEAENPSTIFQKLRVFNETGEEFVLDTNDIALDLNNFNKELISEKDLILIHATNIKPVDNKIMTPLEINSKHDYNIQFVNGNTYKAEISDDFHNSIHFSINTFFANEVCKYAICIPLNKFDGKIYGGTECDLFSEGSVPINKYTYILCPEDEMGEIKNLNFKAKVIGFKGNNSCSYINKFINLGLEYKYKEPDINEKEWKRDNQDKEFIYTIFKKNKWYIGNYSDTPMLEIENRKQCMEKIIKNLLIIKENDLINKEGEDLVRQFLIDTFECRK